MPVLPLFLGQQHILILYSPLVYTSPNAGSVPLQVMVQKHIVALRLLFDVPPLAAGRMRPARGTGAAAPSLFWPLHTHKTLEVITCRSLSCSSVTSRNHHLPLPIAITSKMQDLMVKGCEFPIREDLRVLKTISFYASVMARGCGQAWYSEGSDLPSWAAFQC